MIALLLRPASSCTTRSPACLPQRDEGLRARQLSPSSWEKASPSRGLRAAGGSCRRPLLSCLRWRATEQWDQGATSTTGAPLRCPKPWEQQEGARFQCHVLRLLQASQSQRFHLGVVVGPELQWSWRTSAVCLHSSTGLPEGPCTFSPKLLHVLTPVTRRDAIHPPSIPGWVLWTTGRSALKRGPVQEQPGVTSSHGNGGVWR